MKSHRLEMDHTAFFRYVSIICLKILRGELSSEFACLDDIIKLLHALLDQSTSNSSVDFSGEPPFGTDDDMYLEQEDEDDDRPGAWWMTDTNDGSDRLGTLSMLSLLSQMLYLIMSC